MKKYAVHVYLGLLCLYNLQGTLYPSGSIISQAILFIVLLWSLYCFFSAHIKYKPPLVMKVLSILIILWIVYGLFRILAGPVASWVPSYFYLKNILISLLPIYAFYLFTKRGLITNRLLIRWFFIFLIVGIASYYRMLNEGLELLSKDETTNNAGYIILSLICLLPLLKRKPLLQYSVLVLLLYFVLLGYKRGAIITGVICALFFLYENYRLNRQTGGKVNGRQILRILFTIGVVFTAFYIVQQTLTTSDYFVRRLEETLEGNSSERNIIYSSLYALFITQDSILTFLFGNGPDATIRIAGYYAHNDWLEIAINNGLWMVILYALYWVLLIRYIISIRNTNSLVYMMASLFFIIYFMKTFFSMSYNSVTFYAACAFGYALAIGKQSIDESQGNYI